MFRYDFQTPKPFEETIHRQIILYTCLEPVETLRPTAAAGKNRSCNYNTGSVLGLGVAVGYFVSGDIRICSK